MRTSTYATRQREALLDYLLTLGDGHVTVDQMTTHFSATATPIGRTTVYRFLERLVQEGSARRFTMDGMPSACYQHIREPAHCTEHFHLKCERCGVLMHLECHELAEVEHHILTSHTFKVNPLKTVLYGTCEHCLSVNVATEVHA